VNWEGTFYSNTVRNLTDCESFANAIALAADNNSLEDLDTALATFDNANVDLELIACAKLWDVMAK
jgi:hypothetical protein